MNWDNYSGAPWMQEQPRGLNQLSQPQQLGWRNQNPMSAPAGITGSPQVLGWMNPNPIAMSGLAGTPQVQGWRNPNPIAMNQPQGYQQAGVMQSQQPRQFGNRLADLGGAYMPRQSMYQRMW